MCWRGKGGAFHTPVGRLYGASKEGRVFERSSDVTSALYFICHPGHDPLRGLEMLGCMLLMCKFV